MDEAPVGERLLELVAQLAHVHVHRAVPRAQGAAPHAAVELLARDDRAEATGHGDEQLELAHGKRERAPGGEHEPFFEPDLELARV